MTDKSSATLSAHAPISSSRAGLAWGFVGVLAFSFTVPFTRVAVEGLSPLFVGSGRAVIAAVLASAALALTRQRLPRGTQWIRLVVVAGGVVVGFPLLTSFALTTASASHGAVVVALLPATTAVMAVIRGKERPSITFWVMAGIGAAVALIFASVQGSALGAPTLSDLLIFGAVIAAAIGYAEGGLLARELGSWQTVSWALVIASPLMVLLTIATVAQQPPTATPTQWAAFGYLAVVSMFLGFVAWYRGLAIGPIARVSQVQLVQPVITIVWAALLLGEALTWPTIVGGVVVVLCAAIAVSARLRRPAGVPAPSTAPLALPTPMAQ